MLVSDIRLVSSETECELQAQVRTDSIRKPFVVRYRFPRKFENFISPENGDPFVAALLLPAMKTHEILEITAPVSPKLLHSVDEIQAIYTRWNPMLSEIEIRAPVRNQQLSAIGRPSHAGLFFSCGVDSFYSLLKNIEGHQVDDGTITDLIVVHGFDIYFGRRTTKVFDDVLANAYKVGQCVSKNVLPVATNLRDFSGRFVDWVLYHGAALASVGLTLESVFQEIHIASSHSNAQLMPWGSHPLLDPLWSTDRLSLIHDDCEPSRVDKIRFIAQFPMALETLRVCTLSTLSQLYNCGSCEKCLRTMVGLQIAAALQKCKTLPRSIDFGLLNSVLIRDQNAKSFIEELVTNLGSSECDLALRAALEGGLHASGASRVKRLFFWAMNYVSVVYAPSLFPMCNWIQRAFTSRSTRRMQRQI
jgi:hypothetical protein